VPDPTHTVIVPAYNAAETIEQTIRSVRAQTDSSFELIAVDDGSTDATPSLLRRMAAEEERIQVIRQDNAGPSAAREAAMGRASGGYLTFLDSDDLLMPSYLETMAETLGAAAEIGLAFARGWVLDDAAGGGRIRRAVWPAPGEVAGSNDDPADAVVALASGNYVGGVQTARRSAVERAGGLDAGLDQAEDYDLWLRIAIAGFRIVPAPGTLVVLRNRSGSLSNDELELARGVRAVCERILSVYDVPDEARRAARAQLDRANREIELVSGRAPARAALRRLRLALGRAKRRLLSRRLWYAVPPPEVAEAFPDLVARRAPPRQT
jgi:glycosyltransferase involved in cell wall biosynthesis